MPIDAKNKNEMKERNKRINNQQLAQKIAVQSSGNRWKKNMARQNLISYNIYYFFDFCPNVIVVSTRRRIYETVIKFGIIQHTHAHTHTRERMTEPFPMSIESTTDRTHMPHIWTNTDVDFVANSSHMNTAYLTAKRTVRYVQWRMAYGCVCVLVWTRAIVNVTESATNRCRHSSTEPIQNPI